jgi:hypothetical protein
LGSFGLGLSLKHTWKCNWAQNVLLGSSASPILK